MKLSEKWQKVVEQNGKYAVQIKFLIKTKNVLFLLKNQRNFLANPAQRQAHAQKAFTIGFCQIIQEVVYSVTNNKSFTNIFRE